MGRKNQEVTLRTVCGMPDFLRCGLLVDLRDGVITKVRPTGPDDPTAGRACPKGLTIREMAYHPDRLRYPMKRIGARGEGKWKRVTWDEALDDIAVRLQEISGQYGPASVAWMTYVFMELTCLLGAGYSRLMSLTGGTHVEWWGCGDAANPCADLATFGTIIGGTYLSTMSDPKFGMIWGSTLANVPALQRIDPEPTLEINPADAESRNINHGDVVRVFNDRGQLRIQANVTPNIKPGVVNTTEGWWPEQYIEGQVNNLTHDRKNSAQDHIMQANAAFYDVLVEVEKVEV